MNPYEILGVPHDATDNDIRHAWRVKSLEAHPDREGGDAEAQSQLNVARDILLDHSKRKALDAGKDPATSSLESEARQMLASWVTSIAADPELIDKSIADLIRQTIVNAKIENEIPILQIEQDIKVMEHRLNEVRTYQTDIEHNLFSAAIEAMIKDARSQLHQINHVFDILAEAERILNDLSPKTEVSPWQIVMS